MLGGYTEQRRAVGIAIVVTGTLLLAVPGLAGAVAEPLEPEVFASGEDTFATVLYQSSRADDWYHDVVLQGAYWAGVEAPDGSTLTVTNQVDKVVYAVISLDGTVLAAKDVGEYFTKCEPLDPDAISVEGSLAGAPADGTWTLKTAGDMALWVQGKEFNKMQPAHDGVGLATVLGTREQVSATEHGFTMEGCPTTNAGDLVENRSWNWHVAPELHAADTDSRHEIPENPAFHRTFVTPG